jgi:predicted transposase YdaD
MLAHGRDARLAPALLEAVLNSARGLDTERYSFYVDLALSAVSGKERRALEAMMRSGTYQYQSELVRKLVGQGRQEGRQEGLEQGEQKGRLEGERRALFQVLAARGLKVEGAARRRILACTELSLLERWLSLAVKVQSVRQLLEHEAPRKPIARTRASRPQPRRLRAGR